MIAISIKGIGRYFGERMDFKNAPPNVMFRRMLGLLGFNIKLRPSDQTQVAVNSGGQVLRDVSLEIEKGSVVCLLGPTDSGKTTLLRILAGGLPPTEGYAEMRGTVSVLLSIGDNVDPNWSALEIIENYCTQKKIPAKQAVSYAHDVIEFAELAGFETSLVRTYSTGMKLRLSVALALQGEPDILLMDDVIGVGDLSFQQKFVERLLEMKESGCTMLLVLSDIALIQQLATRVVEIADGRIREDGLPAYFLGRDGFGSAETKWHVSDNLPAGDAVTFQAITVNQIHEGNKPFLDVTIEFRPRFAPQECRPIMDLLQGKTLVFRSIGPNRFLVTNLDPVSATVRIPIHLLTGGDYNVGLSINSVQGEMVYSCKSRNAIALEIKRSHRGPDKPLPLIADALQWEVEPLL